MPMFYYSHACDTNVEHLQGLIISIVDNCPFLSFCLILLEFEIFLKNWCETVSLQQASLLDNFLWIFRQVFKVVYQGHTVTFENEHKICHLTVTDSTSSI